MIVAIDETVTLSGEQTIQNVALTDGMRVAYIVAGVDAGLSYVREAEWERTEDMAEGSSASCSYCLVDQGAYQDKGIMCITDTPNDIVGTDSLTFTKCSAMEHLVAEGVLEKDGDTIRIKAGSLVKKYPFVITETDITDKKLTLPETPHDPNKVEMTVRKAPMVLGNEDAFKVTGSELSWDGYWIDGIIRAGDKGLIAYTV